MNAALPALLAAVLFSGCAIHTKQPPLSKQPAVESSARGSVAIGRVGSTQSKATGRGYRHFETDDQGGQVATRAQRRAEHAAALDAIPGVALDDSNKFKGRARAHAKTTIAHAKLERFATLPDLVASLPDDQVMLSYQPRIDRDTSRVKEELRNVGVCAWIVATKREEDNDYHIILADDDGKTFLTAEMSGLPEQGGKLNRKRLADARATFEDFVATEGRNANKYIGWGDPVPVYVEGSLFYDTEHKPGVVGPKFARPATSWEIHPISKVLFEPGPELCNPL